MHWLCIDGEKNTPFLVQTFLGISQEDNETGSHKRAHCTRCLLAGYLIPRSLGSSTRNLGTRSPCGGFSFSCIGSAKSSVVLYLMQKNENTTCSKQKFHSWLLCCAAFWLKARLDKLPPHPHWFRFTILIYWGKRDLNKLYLSLLRELFFICITKKVFTFLLDHKKEWIHYDKFNC